MSMYFSLLQIETLRAQSQLPNLVSASNIVIISRAQLAHTEKLLTLAFLFPSRRSEAFVHRLYLDQNQYFL